MAGRRQFYATTTAIVLVAAVAACSDTSGTQSSSETAGASASTSTSVSPSSASSDSTAGVPPGAKLLGTVRTGEAFTFTLLTSDTPSEPDQWKLTVHGVDCGESLDRAVMAYAADSVGAPTVMPAPEAGKQFCVLTMNGTNVGKSMASWNAQNTVSLNVGDTRYTETQKDDEYATDYDQYSNSKGQTPPTFGINPGSHGPVHGVFEIPTGDKPTSVWVTAGTAIETIYGVQPGHLVVLQ